MRRVVHTSHAELDLLEIWTALLVHGDAAADRTLGLIEKRCDVLRQFPFGGEACPRFGPDTRWFPAGRYVIFYRVIDNDVHVVRVLDGRRDLDDAFWRTH